MRLLLLFAVASQTSADRSTEIRSNDGALAVSLSANGVTSVSVGGNTYSVTGGVTSLGGGDMGAPGTCAKVVSGALRDNKLGGVTIEQVYLCSVPDASTQAPVNITVSVSDSFSTAPHSVAITTTIGVPGGQPRAPFTTALRTALDWKVGAIGSDAKVWLPWSKGCVKNNGRAPGMCFASGEWQEALTPEALPATVERYRYGLASDRIPGGWKDSFSLPVVTVLDATHDAGISLVLEPSDPTLELLLHTAPTGVGFQREMLRIGGLSNITYTSHIVGHAACWRPALAFLTRSFPDYFEPWVSDETATSFEGLGSYSWNQEPYNATYARSVGFKTNWDLSGTWMPYDGLFLPYQERWLNLGPINEGLAQYNVTYDMINDYYERIQQAGFHSLSYFDIGNWGTRTNTNYHGPTRYCGQRPGGQPAPCPDPNGANSYLRDALWPALLHHGWSVEHGQFEVHYSDWVGTTDMDTMVPTFEDLLVEQLERHLTRLSAFEGIAIDRLDYSEFYNYDTDDNISWVPFKGTGSNLSSWRWGPARSLRVSYQHTFERLHQLLHASTTKLSGARDGGDKDTPRVRDRLMLNNCNWLCRLDLNHAFDGTFSEGAALNSVAFIGLRQPSILWTYSLSDNVSGLDEYFQQHLLMDVYPMAPMPKNDHSITPGSAVVEQAYRDYAPSFDAMHGARWLLTTRPLSLRVNASSAPAANLSAGHANVFTLPTSQSAAPLGGGLPALLVPLVLADEAVTAVTLGLWLEPTVKELGWPAVKGVALSVRYPGSSGETPLGEAALVGAVWEARIPLQRRCAIMTARLRA